MKKQPQMFEDDKLDPEVAKVADRYIDLVKDKKLVKERLAAQEKNLIGLLGKIGKAKIRHGGKIIEVKHRDEADSIALKDDKAVKQQKRNIGKRED